MNITYVLAPLKNAFLEIQSTLDILKSVFNASGSLSLNIHIAF